MGKKVQLQEHFAFEDGLDPSSSDPIVSMSGAMPAFSPAVSSNKKRKVVTAPSAGKQRKVATAPAGPLSGKMKALVTKLLTAEGGSMPLGRLTTLVEGVKKAQLEEHFVVDVGPDPSRSDPLVSLASEDFPLQEPAVKIKKEPREPRTRREDAPPPPDLDSDVLSAITDYLSEKGGFSSLGRLTSDFPGVKKVQLEPHFDFTSVGNDMGISLHGVAYTPDPEQEVKRPIR